MKKNRLMVTSLDLAKIAHDLHQSIYKNIFKAKDVFPFSDLSKGEQKIMLELVSILNDDVKAALILKETSDTSSPNFGFVESMTYSSIHFVIRNIIMSLEHHPSVFVRKLSVTNTSDIEEDDNALKEEMEKFLEEKDK